MPCAHCFFSRVPSLVLFGWLAGLVRDWRGGVEPGSLYAVCLTHKRTGLNEMETERARNRAKVCETATRHLIYI